MAEEQKQTDPSAEDFFEYVRKINELLQESTKGECPQGVKLAAFCHFSEEMKEKFKKQSPEGWEKCWNSAKEILEKSGKFEMNREDENESETD